MSKPTDIERVKAVLYLKLDENLSNRDIPLCQDSCRLSFS